jgi:uncharacterized protein YaiL (DUF2058 family)
VFSFILWLCSTDLGFLFFKGVVPASSASQMPIHESPAEIPSIQQAPLSKVAYARAAFNAPSQQAKLKELRARAKAEEEAATRRRAEEEAALEAQRQYEEQLELQRIAEEEAARVAAVCVEIFRSFQDC